MNILLLACLVLAVTAGFGHGDTMKSFPYQAYILHNGKHECGGAIISNIQVMTVGKCLVDPLKEYKIRVGSDDPNSGGATVNINKIKKHPDYNEKTGENDIVIAELDTPLLLNDKIKPVTYSLERVATGVMQPYVGKYDSAFWKPLSLVPPKICKERFNVLVAKDKTCFVLRPSNPSMECKIMRGDPLVERGQLVGLVTDNYECSKQRGLFGAIGRFFGKVGQWLG